ncbi:MAG: ubiquinone-binding protein, partial [Betaproteobacteria bacterium]|nr:ubiquinone-binding protein [Betaproteobacteria bacterium]
MREMHRSALVPYSAEQMFDLVEGVEHYPEFLPWCTGTRLIERRD